MGIPGSAGLDVLVVKWIKVPNYEWGGRIAIPVGVVGILLRAKYLSERYECTYSPPAMVNK